MLNQSADQVPSLVVLSGQELQYTLFRNDIAQLGFAHHRLTITIDIGRDEGRGTSIQSFIPFEIQQKMMRFPHDILEACIVETSSNAVVLTFEKCGTIVIPERSNVHLKVEDNQGDVYKIAADIDVIRTDRRELHIAEWQWNQLFHDQQAFVCGVLHQFIEGIIPAPPVTPEDIDVEMPYISLLRIYLNGDSVRLGQSFDTLEQGHEYDLIFRIRGNGTIRLLFNAPSRRSNDTDMNAVNAPITAANWWRTIKLTFHWRWVDPYASLWIIDDIAAGGWVDLTDMQVVDRDTGIARPVNIVQNGYFQRAAGDAMGYDSVDAPKGKWGGVDFADKDLGRERMKRWQFVLPLKAGVFEMTPWLTINRLGLEYFINAFDPNFLQREIEYNEQIARTQGEGIAILNALWDRTVYLLNRFIQIKWNKSERYGVITSNVIGDTDVVSISHMKETATNFINKALDRLTTPQGETPKRVNVSTDILPL